MVVGYIIIYLFWHHYCKGQCIYHAVALHQDQKVLRFRKVSFQFVQKKRCPFIITKLNRTVKHDLPHTTVENWVEAHFGTEGVLFSPRHKHLALETIEMQLVSSTRSTFE